MILNFERNYKNSQIKKNENLPQDIIKLVKKVFE